MKRPKSKRVTLADVAAKAGVSVATASVAITGRRSGNCRVSPAVAETIRRAARQLNYRPNLQARMLSTQRTHTVAVLIKREAWNNSMHSLSAAQQVLRGRGYSEIFLLHPDNELSSESEQLELCIQRGVEGIILNPLVDPRGRTNAQLIDRIREEDNIPIVQLGLSIPGCAAPAVVPDEQETTRAAVRLLHGMGHERIAHATLHGYADAGPLNPFPVVHPRYRGYRDGMLELGLIAHEQVLVTQEPTPAKYHLYEIGREIGATVAKLSSGRRPTALIAYSDYLAMGLLASFVEAGVRVPQDISILGYGNQQFGEMVRPALSTLAPAFDEMGRLATETLLSMIEDGAAGESVALPPSLVMRQSVQTFGSDSDKGKK